MDSLLIYGSYGYTGRLIAREAVSRGGSPVVAGRNGRAVSRQADELGVEGRTFDLSDAADVAAHLRSFDAVLNCAGPFVNTVDPLVDACLETDTHYLDISGEFQAFERLRRRDEAARAAGITLLPGVGFDVVPTDCLASFLHSQLPEATALSLGIKGGGGLSRGTARTFVEHLGDDGVVRRNGRLIKVPMAYRSREIDFGDGPEHAVTIPWGDVVTAAHSTGIDSIEVYAAAPSWATRALSAVDSLGWLLERRPVEAALERLVDARIDGPDDAARSTGAATVWGEAVDETTGRRARARLRAPNPYALTAEAAVSAAKRVIDGNKRSRSSRGRLPVGFQTPSSAFDSDFVLELSGTERELLEAPAESAEPERSALESD
ncbi:saccharopine dehydrogenase NADP-binding domain-containing protein [Haloterrigena salifodinae]|uniref:Saccharopine dehydrogenase NADP-binding domain-containing protein n=1 Tax=Haloterrigena salifodinae TaxID=2675099 RepID=A0A8T8E2F4_9EURY|nr:saccharopine dehydrogenase NADP-binding domain-containing protein [Haloterrigena salifodinae]QRV15686.1 saccharopine dehydrogenase NADP-binding domain-containing protein [Haloterrigena salifodinae]